MFRKAPEGYRKLLAYQKAVTLQQLTNDLVLHLPRTKTFLDLADQMSRSGRSGSKNIVEGWKRNTTKEYFSFLGFSIGAVGELMEDAADVITGVYPALMNIEQIMGKASQTKDFKEIMSRTQLDLVPFYPVQQDISPIVVLFLKAKEVCYLIYRLQQSLDIKMDNEFTKPAKYRIAENINQEKEADKWLERYMHEQGMVRLQNGKIVSGAELEEIRKVEERNKGL